jgi:predicted HNH restriction endonuclease
MRQVIGRGLRSPEAACTVHILDGRYRNIEAFVPNRFRAQWQQKGFLEGQRRELTLSAIERNPSVRKKALAHYGMKCTACDFVPKVSGQLDIHHLNPVSVGGERLTQLTDLAVLCANCHRLAHSVEPPMPMDVLRKLQAIS